MNRLLAAALIAACAVGGIAPAFAADGGKDTADRKARFEQWCKDNPEKCKAAQERAAQCKADPEKCRAERRAKREQLCKENPERCAQAKARAEERRKLCEANPSECPPARRPGAGT